MQKKKKAHTTFIIINIVARISYVQGQPGVASLGTLSPSGLICHLRPMFPY